MFGHRASKIDLSTSQNAARLRQVNSIEKGGLHMRRFLMVAIPVFLIGFIAGNAFWYLASPLWIDRVVSEALPPELRLTKISEGPFSGADALHQSTGTLTVLKTGGGTILLRFTDFEVTNGPSLKVYLAKAADPATASDVLDGGWISLGALRGNIGDQTYTLPDNVNLSDYKSLVIWCEPFKVLFASAPLAGS
jgi:electron transfer DM13